MEIPKKTGDDQRGSKLTSRLHTDQEELIRVADVDSELELTGQGVPQGRPLSPTLFTYLCDGDG